jgi:hypothetical protein
LDLHWFQSSFSPNVTPEQDQGSKTNVEWNHSDPDPNQNLVIKVGKKHFGKIGFMFFLLVFANFMLQDPNPEPN